MLDKDLCFEYCNCKKKIFWLISYLNLENIIKINNDYKKTII